MFGFLLDGVLLSVGQTEKVVSILFLCRKACVIGFVGHCVSSRFSYIACFLITSCKKSLTSSSVDDSRSLWLRHGLISACSPCDFFEMMSSYCVQSPLYLRKPCIVFLLHRIQSSDFVVILFMSCLSCSIKMSTSADSATSTPASDARRFGGFPFGVWSVVVRGSFCCVHCWLLC